MQKPETPEPKNMDEIKALIKKHGLGPNNKSKAHDLLIEGLEVIKSRKEYNQKLKEAGSIGLDVDQMGGWVYNLVRDTVGGTINTSKLVLTWELDGKTIEYNPYDGKLEYAS